jgi:ABC-type uncharacterized transport system substrate-binding protein
LRAIPRESAGKHMMTNSKAGPSTTVFAVRAVVATSLCWLAMVGCQPEIATPRGESNGNASSSSPSVGRNASSVAGKKLLLVHSYHKEYEWVAQLTRGVRRSLEKSGVELHVFYMDTKRRSDEAWKRKSGEAAAAVVEQWKPDAVIAADDNAQEYFAKRYADRDSPQIVFCGVNGEPGDFGYPAKNVTGILERPHFVATLDILHQIVPGARRIAIITDNSETSAGAVKYMKEHPDSVEIVSSDAPNTFEEWKKAVERVQGSADAVATYTYHTVAQPNSPVNMEPREVMAWTVEHSKLPVLGFFVFAVDDGALCGMVESGVEHGYEAGQIALGLLGGKKAADYPVTTASHGQSMLNRTTANHLGITVPDRVLKRMDLVLDSKDAKEQGAP